MGLCPGNTFYREFTLVDTTQTGSPAANASATPVVTVKRNGVTDATVTAAVTVTNPSTGEYAVQFVIPLTYAKGDNVLVMVSATVAGIPGKHELANFYLDTLRVGDLNNPSAAQIAAAVMGDTTDPVGAAVLAIKTQTDKLLFDASNFLKTNPQTPVALTALAQTNLVAAIENDLTDPLGAAIVAIKAKTDLLPTWPAHISDLVIDATGRIQVQTGTAAGQINLSGGNLAGPVPSVTGAVGSVTGNVGGNVVGSVGTVLGNIGGNVLGSVGSVAGDVAGNVAGSVGSVTGNVGGNVVGSVGSIQGITFPTNFGLLHIDADGNVSLRGIRRGQPLDNFVFPMLSAADGKSYMPGLTVTATRKLDGGSFAACANSPSEVGNGLYTINFSAADMSGQQITVQFSAPGALTRTFTIITQG